MKTTKEEMVAAIQIAALAFRAVAEMGAEGMNEGSLYAVMMSKLSEHQFTGMVALLVGQGLVRRENGKLFAAVIA